jgi:hypothetical protein
MRASRLVRHEAMLQRVLPIIAGEAVDAAQGLGGGEHIGCDDLVEQAGELGIGEADAVQRLELFAKVLLQRGAVGDIAPIFVFEALEGANEAGLDAVLARHRTRTRLG